MDTSGLFPSTSFSNYDHFSSISTSIRANQHTETLQAQYAVLQQQKEDLSVKLSEAEDRESKHRAALINLQCVLEQFQKGEPQQFLMSKSKMKESFKLHLERSNWPTSTPTMLTNAPFSPSRANNIDKDRDIQAITQRIRNELTDELGKRQHLHTEVDTLKSQLDESKAGLLAAARISDQLEIAQVTASTIKEECK